MLPITKGREGRALLLFVVQFLICLALVSWLEGTTGNGILETLIAIGQSMGRLIVFITATTIIIIEGWAMVAERYLRNRYNAGRAEGFADGYKEGYAKAIEEMKKERQEQADKDESAEQRDQNSQSNQ